MLWWCLLSVLLLLLLLPGAQTYCNSVRDPQQAAAQSDSRLQVWVQKEMCAQTRRASLNLNINLHSHISEFGLRLGFTHRFYKMKPLGMASHTDWNLLKKASQKISS